MLIGANRARQVGFGEFVETVHAHQSSSLDLMDGK
jgi:hypothetical protein